MPNRPRLRSRWLLRLAGPALLGLILWRLDNRAELIGAMRAAIGIPLLAAVVLNVPIVALKVLRWRLLLRARGFDYGGVACHGAVLSSLYLGMVTPGRIGDAIRVQYAQHEADIPYREGLAVTLVDRFCDLYVLAAFVAAGLFLFAEVLGRDLVMASIAVALVSVVGPLALFVDGLAERVLAAVLGRRGADWQRGAAHSLSAMRSLARPAAARAVPLTVVAFLLNYAQGYLIAHALGARLSFWEVSSLLAMTSLLGLLPISISGIGIRELFLGLAFTALSWPHDRGVAFGLLVFVCNHLVIALMGFVAWQLHPPPLSAPDVLRDPVDGERTG